MTLRLICIPRGPVAFEGLRARGAMYVCICHGFTDSQVRSLTDEGCRSLAQVYRSLSGEAPQ